ncbi:hypothetical protein [Frankia sp. CiP3]|uniref:hypothetical protein n=1 Tax=Frankia sp. CiP3 TaxID=2880971 RepID=UPI001EF6B06B|nr:hypothetical protein [Frankia sp. CiP3]
MIDVAIIASVGILTRLSGRGTIDMALTHLVLTDPAYTAYHAARSAVDGRVILDNSAYELAATSGRGLPATDVLTAAAMVGASDVICQDVLYDGPATLAATSRFLTEAADARYQPSRFMAVPQGTTRAEWLTSYDALAALPGIDLIGLSKLSVPRCWGRPVAEARLACVAELAARGGPHLHLLGGDRSLPWELREHRRRGHEAVRSNDSSFAYWYAASGIPVDETTGRAAREASAPPDLTHRQLTDEQLTDAERLASLVLEAAGHSTRRPVEATR